GPPGTRKAARDVDVAAAVERDAAADVCAGAADLANPAERCEGRVRRENEHVAVARTAQPDAGPLEGTGDVGVTQAVHRNAGGVIGAGATQGDCPQEGAVRAQLADEDVAVAGAGQVDRTRAGVEV